MSRDSTMKHLTTNVTPAGSALAGAGAALIAVIGLVHWIDMPSSFQDAPYKGLLFLLNGIAAVVVVYGIAQASRWSWLLGILVAGGALVGYVISRTIGLPGIPPDDWLDPLGILSLVVEVGFLLVAFSVLRQPTRPAPTEP